MGRILRRIKTWKRKRAEQPTDADTSDDWKTVGHTFRATDVVFDKNLPVSSKDEGRPPH